MVPQTFIQVGIKCNSTMVDDTTILEIPAVEISGETLDNFRSHIEDVFEFLGEEDIEKIIEDILMANTNKFILAQLFPYKGKRKTTERTKRDEAMARYNTTNLIDDEDEDN